MDELLVDVAEAARRLRIGRSMVYEFIASGAIASVRLGRRRLIPVFVLEDFIKRQLAASTAAIGARDTTTRP